MRAEDLLEGTYPVGHGGSTAKYFTSNISHNITTLYHDEQGLYLTKMKGGGCRGQS